MGVDRIRKVSLAEFVHQKAKPKSVLLVTITMLRALVLYMIYMQCSVCSAEIIKSNLRGSEKADNWVWVDTITFQPTETPTITPTITPTVDCSSTTDEPTVTPTVAPTIDCQFDTYTPTDIPMNFPTTNTPTLHPTKKECDTKKECITNQPTILPR